MLTIFSTPKAFRGHFGVIQRNAIGSWLRLSPAPQIILFGDSDGTKETAAELGLEHVPAVETNEFGTPYLRALIESATQLARYDLLCYVNADIILTEGFERAVRHVSANMKEFLLVGRRLNIDLNEPIAFDANWRQWLQAKCQERAKVGDHTSIDFFVFPKNFYRDIPPLVIGRAWFDQWMIESALQRAAVVDASALAPIVHQNHDYGHIAGGRASVFHGVEAERNLALCKGRHAHTLLDCTHEITPACAICRTRFRKARFQARHFLWKVFIHRTAGIRDTLKLRRKYWRSEERSDAHRPL
jgi:hypothetical protein